MTGLLSQAVLDQRLVQRLAIYKAAVEAGFYNEADNTVTFRHHQIVHDESRFVVMRGGVNLATFIDPFVAKCWIISRLDHCSLADASRRLRRQERLS